MNINLTLLFQVLFFAVFVWFSKRYVWTPIIAALNERRAGIADGLASAEKGKAAEAEGQTRAEAAVDEAKGRAREIIARAESRGAELVEEAKEAAKAEAEKLKAAARNEVALEAQQAREALRGEVAVLAIKGAGRILGREVDEAAHAAMLNDLGRQL